jgi:hypothetical protein
MSSPSIGERGAGSVITFYSFKGGTGRTMALANVACLLGAAAAPRGGRVLAVDWDLEAPGLHRYLMGEARDGAAGGVIEYFSHLRATLGEGAIPAPQGDERLAAEWLGGLAPLDRFVVRDVAGLAH